MKLIEATREFQIRYYRWAKSEFETEINNAFPNLRTFRNGPIWEAFQFLQQLNKNEQLTLAHSLLKRFHSDAIKLLGEGCSDEEKCWLNKFDKTRAQFNESALNVASIQKIKYASKSKLRKAMGATFAKVYRERCVNMQIGKDWDPWFEMKIAGWIVTTRFTFGRHESMINYYHSIESEAKIPNLEFPPEFWMPAMRLEHLMSFASWLGICGQTQWMHLAGGDVDEACEAVIKFCGQFFEAVPGLLKGLEFESITEGVIAGAQS